MSINTLHLSTTSREFIRVRVTASEAGVAVNPTGDTVQFAFPAAGASPSSWTAGAWETAGTSYFARILVGTGTSVTVAGNYDVWVRVTDSPEVPTRRVGLLILS